MKKKESINFLTTENALMCVVAFMCFCLISKVDDLLNNEKNQRILMEFVIEEKDREIISLKNKIKKIENKIKLTKK